MALEQNNQIKDIANLADFRYFSGNYSRNNHQK